MASSGFAGFARVSADRTGRADAEPCEHLGMRRLLDEATHQEVFGWVLGQVTRAGLLQGKTIGIDERASDARLLTRNPPPIMFCCRGYGGVAGCLIQLGSGRRYRMR
jgi:hypothetical protein